MLTPRGFDLLDAAVRHVEAHPEEHRQIMDGYAVGACCIIGWCSRFENHSHHEPRHLDGYVAQVVLGLTPEQDRSLYGEHSNTRAIQIAKRILRESAPAIPAPLSIPCESPEVAEPVAVECGV